MTLEEKIKKIEAEIEETKSEIENYDEDNLDEVEYEEFTRLDGVLIGLEIALKILTDD